MNNTLERINNRITEAEEWISDLEERLMEITAIKQNIEKRMKRNDDSLRDFRDNIKCTNIHILGVPEGEGSFSEAQLVNNPPAVQETLVRFLGREDPLEKG